MLSIVRDLSHELLTPLGASSAGKATVDTYTEVTLDSHGKSVRPNGVIRVTYGKRSFTALVEVKTGDNRLDKNQINEYWQSARQAGYDHIITISNEIAPSGAHPVVGICSMMRPGFFLWPTWVAPGQQLGTLRVPAPSTAEP